MLISTEQSEFRIAEQQHSINLCVEQENGSNWGLDGSVCFGLASTRLSQILRPMTVVVGDYRDVFSFGEILPALVGSQLA